MANYRERSSGEVGRKRAAKIQMSLLKPSVERRAPFVSLILRRGMISGYYPAKVNIGSTKPVLTHGCWNSRAHARCAVRVCNVLSPLF